MPTRITHNIDRALKKVEKDIKEIQSGIGLVQADVINLAFSEIQKKGFVKGRQEIRNGQVKYLEHPGANLHQRPRRSRSSGKRPNRRPPQPGPKVFQKGKIVDRLGNLPSVFDRPQWSKGFGLTLWKANIKGGNAVVRRSGLKVIGEYEPTGKYQQIFSVFEFKKKKVTITSPTEEKDLKIGQKKVVSNGFRRAIRRFKRLAELRIKKTLQERNGVKI